MKDISLSQAEKVARAHACVICGEYSFKKLQVKPVEASERTPLGECWRAVKVCGVCGAQQELGIDADGDIVYET